jgi:hypothetical protein
VNRLLLAGCALALSAAAAAAQGRTVAVMATEFKFDMPDSIPAGVTTFELRSGGSEMHHMQIVRLEQGKTAADFEAAMRNPGPPPAWVTFVGGPNAPIPNGQAVSSVTVNLTPGTYVMLCLIPSPDGAIHLMKGMVKPVKVTGRPAAPAGAAMPKADYVMTLYDYNFDVDKPMKAGRRTIEFRNTAKQFHEALLVRLPAGAPVGALPEWISQGMTGPPPAIPMGGIVGLSPGQVNIVTVDLEPGEYGLYCFLPAPDGKEHIVHGMLKKIVVTR